MNKIEQLKVENKIIHGDSAHILYDLQKKSVDLVVTSPPYSDLRKYGGVIDTWNENKFKDIVRGLWDVLKDGGVVVRKYIGIELNKDYVELSKKRINDLAI